MAFTESPTFPDIGSTDLIDGMGACADKDRATSIRATNKKTEDAFIGNTPPHKCYADSPPIASEEESAKRNRLRAPPNARRLVAPKKAKKKLITRKEAVEGFGIPERYVRRLLRELKRRGDKVVVHALRGLRSNRKVDLETQQNATAPVLDPAGIV